MQPHRWRRLQDLFLELTESEQTESEQTESELTASDPGSRQARLDEIQTEDENLYHELLDMLRAHDGDSQLEIEGRILSVQSVAGASLEGQRLGAYEVRREIGRGGMGTVYLAERVDEYRQKVALKVMAAGMASGELERRFRRERQILARLTHPNIAQILDGGVTDDGRPFLVMQYVEGRPITAFCESRKLDVEARLRLFRTVCDAVHHAHGNLIVHRDLKPSNILVTDDGDVTLLDFGIAKLLESENLPNSGEANVTRSELRLMTPEHAAPEQVLDQPVTTATDTWALGVLLYELVAGVKPFSRGDSETRLDLEVSICEQDPQPPSVVGDIAPRRRISGDIDSIVLHALRKSPADRYSSAEQLSEDVRRHLDGEPVRVRASTLRYRAGRFLRRNAWKTVAAVALTLTLVAFAVTSTLQSRALEAERDAARLERDTSEQVTQVLVDLFETTDPKNRPGSRQMTVDELLKLHTDQVVAGLEGNPRVQARLRHILGTVHRAHSRFDESRELLRDALRQQLQISDWTDEETLAIHHELAVLEASFGLRSHGQRMLRQSLDLHRAYLGERHESVAVCLEDLAGSLPAGSEEKIRLFEESLLLRRELEPEPGIGTASVLNNLGLALHGELRFEEALELFRQSGELVEQNLGGDHPFAVAVQTNVASTLAWLDRTDEAIALDRELVTQNRRIYGDESTEVANALNNLAAVLTEDGRWSEAEEIMTESFELSNRLMGLRHTKVQNTARNLAYVFEFQGRWVESEALLQRILSAGAASPRDGFLNEMQLAGLRLRSGQTDAAIADLEELWQRLQAADLPLDLTLRTQPQKLLADGYLAVGRYEDAESIFRTLRDLQVEAYGPEHPQLAYADCGLAAALAGQGQAEEARGLFGDCLEVYSLWGWAHPQTVEKFREAARAVGITTPPG